MTKQMINALELDRIYELFSAEGELISRARREGLKHASTDLKKLRKDYSRIGKLIDSLQPDKQIRRRFREVLEHLPVIRIPEPEQILLQHELFEIKVFCHFYLQLVERVETLSLSGNYTLPDLSSLYDLLDPEGQKMPVFRLKSGELDSTFTQQHSLNLRLKQAREDLLSQARTSLDRPRLKESFILSPRETDTIARIEQCGYFMRLNESASGISYRLADDPHCRDLAAKVAELTLKLKVEEERLLESLSGQVQKQAIKLGKAVASAQQLAWDFLRADFGIEYQCCIPMLREKPVIRLKSSRNLPLQLRLKDMGRHYQELDLDFEESRLSLITGPNMGGKTTILKAVGQAIQLARLGIPIPALSATLWLPDQIWMNHTNETLGDNLSSFGREVVSLVGALKLKGRKLFLLDEFAKGTNPTEGEAICSAVLEYLQASGVICIAATHFTAPTRLSVATQFMTAGFEPTLLQDLEHDSDLEHRLKLLSAAMDYTLIKLSRQQSPPRAAVRIAGALGLPEEIISMIPKELV